MDIGYAPSRPVRARGLKLEIWIVIIYHTVAPRAGAWIETVKSNVAKSSNKVAPRAGAWIETFVPSKYPSSLYVAPRAGAWIETPFLLPRFFFLLKSRPVRARGLKLKLWTKKHVVLVVAPRAGAWIETSNHFRSDNAICVAPRAGAWIETRLISRAFRMNQSRPVRARGLKPEEGSSCNSSKRRAPCGRVD